MKIDALNLIGALVKIGGKEMTAEIDRNDLRHGDIGIVTSIADDTPNHFIFDNCVTFYCLTRCGVHWVLSNEMTILCLKP